MIHRAHAAQKSVAADNDDPETTTSPRKRGRHRKVARLPFGEPGVRAGAALSVLGAVLVPQFAHSETVGEVSADGDTRPAPDQTGAPSAPNKLDRFAGSGIAADPGAASKPAQVDAGQRAAPQRDARVSGQRGGPKHALRSEPVLTPEQQIEEWSEANAHIGVPARALEAYGKAERIMRKQQPDCGISWKLLAGIGRIESNHGQFDGAKLSAKGLPSKQIVGIPLDGSEGVQAITDTDGGKMDHDPTWDRAVGPMQFIPSTWTDWATDANGDDFLDPHFIDDAVATAANYLCGEDRDLSTEDGEREALMSYNQSSSYGDMAIEGADRYGSESAPLPKPTQRSQQDRQVERSGADPATLS